MKPFLFAVLCLLAACTPGPWSKEAATHDQLQDDQRACELAAVQEVQRRQSKTGSTMGPAVVGAETGSQSRRLNTTPQGPFADQRGTQLSEEDRLVADCMRGKGYERLKPK